MKSYALQSPVVYLNTHGSVETESLLISHYADARSFFVSSSVTLVVLEWFNFKLTSCFSRRVAKLTWIYCSVKMLGT